MLHAVTSNKPSFKSVTFASGLNVVLADRTKEATRLHTRNGLGKSTLIDIIHFCLGANLPDRLKAPQLDDWAFTTELTLRGQRVRVSRAICSPSTVTIEGDTSGWPIQPETALDGARSLKTREWNTVLGALMFQLSSEGEPAPHEPSFRSLISYFIRRTRDAYSTPFEHHRRQQKADVQVHNAFLLGLGWEYAKEWRLLQDKERLLGQLRKAARVGLMGPVLGSRGELEAVRVRLEARASAQEQQLRDFRVHKEYREIQTRADAITDELHDLANRNFIDQRALSLYERALQEEEGPEPEAVVRVFEEAGASLPGIVRRRLDEVEAFHDALIANRRSFLSAEIERLQGAVAARQAEIERKGVRRASLMEILATHGALDEYRSLGELHAATVSELGDVRQRIANLAEWEAKASALKIDRELLQQSMKRDYEEREPQRRRAMTFFNANSEALYEAPGNLVINVDPKTGYLFDVEIQRSGSQGIESMKVFCYDLMLAQLWAERPVSPGFLIHDSTIFDGVDERQVASAIELAHRESTTHGFQYICTLNSDGLPTGDFSPGFDIDAFVRLQLTDATTEGCLLGIRF